MSNRSKAAAIVARLGALRPVDPDDAALLERIAERNLNRDNIHGLSADILFAYRAGYAAALAPAFAALTPDALDDAPARVGHQVYDPSQDVDDVTDPEPTPADGTPRVDGAR